MGLKGQMVAISTRIPSGSNTIKIAEVTGKGLIKNIGFSGHFGNGIIKLTIDNQVIYNDNGSNFVATTGANYSSGSAGGSTSGVWAQTISNSLNAVLNLPFTSGFSIEITSQTVDLNLNASVSWIVEI